MRSVTQSFHKNVFRAFGPKSHTAGKRSRFSRCLYPISEAGRTERKKLKLGYGIKSTRPSYMRVWPMPNLHAKPTASQVKKSASGALRRRATKGRMPDAQRSRMGGGWIPRCCFANCAQTHHLPNGYAAATTRISPRHRRQRPLPSKPRTSKILPGFRWV